MNKRQSVVAASLLWLSLLTATRARGHELNDAFFREAVYPASWRSRFSTAFVGDFQ